MPQQKKIAHFFETGTFDGARYSDTIFDSAWLAARGLEIMPQQKKIAHFFETGTFAAE